MQTSVTCSCHAAGSRCSNPLMKHQTHLHAQSFVYGSSCRCSWPLTAESCLHVPYTHSQSGKLTKPCDQPSESRESYPTAGLETLNIMVYLFGKCLLLSCTRFNQLAHTGGDMSPSCSWNVHTAVPSQGSGDFNNRINVDQMYGPMYLFPLHEWLLCCSWTQSCFKYKKDPTPHNISIKCTLSLEIDWFAHGCITELKTGSILRKYFEFWGLKWCFCKKKAHTAFKIWLSIWM